MLLQVANQLEFKYQFFFQASFPFIGLAPEKIKKERCSKVKGK